MTECKLRLSGEIVYRILTWVFMGEAFLLLMPIYSIGCLFLPENLYWLSFILLPLFYIFLLYLGWKSRICKDIIVEPVQKSRFQSVLMWIGFALIVFALAEIGIAKWKINYFFGFDIGYFLLILLLLAAILTGILLPFNKHAKGMNFAADGILAGVIINLLVWLFTLGR